MSTGTTAPAQVSGSSQATTPITAAAGSATATQVSPVGASQSASAQVPGAQFNTNVARIGAASSDAASVGGSATSATSATSASAVVPPVSQPGATIAGSSVFAEPTSTTGADDSQPGDPTSNSGGLSVPPGQDIQQVIGGAPGWGDFGDVWTPAMTGTGQWIIAPGGTAPPGADPAKTIYLKPNQGAVNVNGSYVVYDGTGGVAGTLAYAP
ncbi:MAG TPA: hypothetical protein VG410_05405 [Solirubrobacteraceae bacterium]|nr:hypothetical protein [Solirubrobacteraceae bacterium]